MKKFLSVVALFLLVTFGCAHMNYVKVPTPTQYSKWTDEQQEKADAMKGVRYYLPRPFLHLKQSVPVAQRVALISFHYDENEKGYVLDEPENAPFWLKKAMPKKLSITQAFALTLAGQQAGKEGKSSATEQGAPAGGGEKTKKEVGKTETKQEVKPPSELHAQTGFINSTDPVTRLGDRMDVVYLPDFEEQYVIQPHTGLGVADIETKLRNGWAAEVFTNKVDNSNLIPYVINQFEKASDAASGIFTTWAPLVAGLPPVPSISKMLKPLGAKEQGALAGGAEGEKITDYLGNVLVFKVAEVKIAQPGLYPILKPREIKQWLKYGVVVAGPDEDVAFSSFLLQSQVPWIRQDMAFIPCPPFTMIAFNATTDIFIMPATDRLAELKDAQAVNGDSNNGNATDKDLKKKAENTLSAKLKDNLSSNFTPELASMFKTRISVTSEMKSTLITITNLKDELTEQQKNEDTFKKWITDSVGNDKIAGKVNVKFDKSKTVEITINLPISELVKVE